MNRIKNFDPSLLGIDKISFKITDTVINYIEFITMKSLDNENSLYLIFNNVDVYIECNSAEESNEDKYLIFASTGKNKEVLKKYTKVWYEIKNKIETISADKSIEYEKDFMKIRNESDDDLPLGKISNISVCIIAVRSVLQEGNSYYPQVYLHKCSYQFEHKYERED